MGGSFISIRCYLYGELLHGGLQRGLVAGEVGGHGVVEEEQLALHHLHQSETRMWSRDRQQPISSHLDAVLVEELELDLHVRPQLLELCPLHQEARLRVRQLGRAGRHPGRRVAVVLRSNENVRYLHFRLYDICISFVFLHLEVGAISVVLDPGDLVLLDGHHGVLHGLVDDGVDGADEEVEAGEQLVAGLGEGALGLRVAEELLVQLRRLVRQVREAVAQGALLTLRWHYVTLQLIFLQHVKTLESSMDKIHPMQ